MAWQQCPNGHLYDDEKNNSCPYCSNGSINPTIPLGEDMAQPAGGGLPPTMPLDGDYVPPTPEVAGGLPPTMPLDPSGGPTIYVRENENGIAEVMGWLVCVEGEKRGMDFKIHGEKNTIGRGSANDIKIDFDNAVSKGVNAIISYDMRNNKFFIFLGIDGSKNNVYVNNSLLMVPVELKDYDIIEIGHTKLMFRSLCNELFSWEKLTGEKTE